MAKLKGRGGKTGPQDDYDLEEGWWQPGDPKLGRPFVGGGTFRPTDLPVVIKQWVRRDPTDDPVLREIWHDEIRQLNRLKGVPKASLFLATLRDSFFDDKAFTLVLECGDRVPLAHRIRHSKTGWHRAIRGLAGRLRLWQEVRRLAEALGILHGQGFLHRNIDAWSVMTADELEPDFILTGFEWSIRLTENRPRRGSGSNAIHSFYEDWRAVGNLIGWLLGLPSLSKANEPYRVDPAANTEFLFAPERDLLRMLIAADPLVRLDTEVVTELLDRIIPTLEQQRLGSQAKLVLALRLDAQGPMSRAIRDASGKMIPLSSYDEQRRFVADALTDSPRLIRARGYGANPVPTYKLTSPQITLSLGAFPLGRGGETTWSLAEARSILNDRPAQAEILSETPLDGWEIEIIDFGDARRRLPKLQGKTTRWDELIQDTPEDPFVAALDNRSYAAAMLVQVTDMIWRAAHIWPVRRLSHEREGSLATLMLEGRSDPRLDKLSEALGLKPPAARLLAALRDETIQVDDEWQLSPDLAVGRVRSQTTSWRFSELLEKDATSRYLFEASGSKQDLALDPDLYLKLGGSGDDALLERRLQTMKVLREHAELLDMLNDPAGDTRLSRDDPAPIAAVLPDLDRSKGEALNGAWSQLPLYLVQGPPGVGKTRLVRSLVASRLAASPMDRLLLSAQSHSAVDHLLDEVKCAVDELPAEERKQIFPLRCRPLDADTKTDWDREAQASRIVGELASSPLVAASSPAIRRRVKALAQVYRGEPADLGEDDDDEPGPLRRFDRSFERLLRRSANLVFASTNSMDLARLIEERGQFDWSMMEEAGKATGVELLAPLMLSHRRLLIGDHQQLPAFEADKLKALLGNPQRLKVALEAGRDIIAPLFRKRELEDALDAIIARVDERLCSDAVELLLLFESLIVPNVLERPESSRGLAIGKQLLEQHRMHPVLGAIISDVFYESKIKTFAKATDRFAKPSPIVSANADRLPDAPLVFIDIPYVQETVKMQSPERQPRWSNPLEANLCVDVMSLLRARDNERPSLALLSPYRRQVRLLRDTINRAQPRLRNLEPFVPRTEDGWCGTVDSFQGNEADCVIVSLVRNNSRTGAQALGFLSDERRMNVLLSRAKWRLIVVGSIRFLRKRIPVATSLPPNDPLAFLDRLLAIIDPPDGKFREGIEVISMDRLRARQS